MSNLVCEVCGSYGKTGPDLLKFTVCKTDWYCNVYCQKKVWKSCRNTSESQKGHETGKGKSSSSCEACESCGKTGAQLFKCGACKLVRYCSVACQKRDWENHEKDCRVIKVYPDRVISENLSGGKETDFEFVDHVTGKVRQSRDIGNLVATEVDMIVKIQTTMDLTIRPRLMVYNKSRDYCVTIRGYDRYYDSINDKVLLEGLPCVQKDPRFRKLYFKAHLNSDTSLDVYLDCTYNIKNW